MILFDLSEKKLEFENFIKAIQSLHNNETCLIKLKDFKSAQLIAKYIADLSINDLSNCEDQNHKNFKQAPSSNKMVELAINELLLNAIEHGMLNISYDLKTKLLQDNIWEKYINEELAKLSPEKSIKIYFTAANIPNKILIKVEDSGKGFKDLPDLNKNHALKIEKHGRGKILILLGLPDLKYHGCGNIAQFTLQCDPEVLKRYKNIN